MRTCVDNKFLFLKEKSSSSASSSMSDSAHDHVCVECGEKFTQENIQCPHGDHEFSDDVGCESCVECCEGHCISCNTNSAQSAGGRSWSADFWRLYHCYYEKCENVFHLNKDCHDGGYKCTMCRLTFCTKCPIPQCREDDKGKFCKNKKRYKE
jgi:hypothetical protein